MIQNPVINAISLSSHLNCVINQLKQNENAIHSPGLFHGKMGLAIFYYQLSSIESYKEYESKADDLIDVLSEEMTSANLSPDFEHGLAGIGWGIEYLTRNGFLEADTDEVLEDFDNRIYKSIVFTDNLPINVENGLLGYAFYILTRMESCHDSVTYSFLKNLMIEIVNRIVVLVNRQAIKFSEPSGFNLYWELPLILLVFAKMLENGIFTNKIYQVLKELTPKICTLFPLLHCNRAYLLLGILAVNKHCKLLYWKEHADVLAANTSFSCIVEKEFYDKNIFLRVGLSGALVIARSLNKLNILPAETFAPEIWSKRILESSIWETLNKEERPTLSALELLSGFPGILTALMLINNNFKLY